MESDALDFDRLAALAESGHAAFGSAKPFSHIVIDDFLRAADAEAVLREFEQTERGWDFYHHYNEKKQALTHASGMGPRTQALVESLHSPRFIAFLESLSGISGLVCDPELDGAGLHKTLPGGYLNVHTDFLSHTQNRHWSRQFNLLIYLNKDWHPEWNGGLELWDAELSNRVQLYEPIFNRCVIFHTMDESYHGHPHKLSCPPGRDRKSLALYYYRDEGRSLELRPTHYRTTLGDSRLKRLLVSADGLLLRAYSFLKRYTGLSDGIVSRILKRF